MNFDDADCDPVREWVCQSAEGWVRDFGIDGLRLDAIHAIFDQSPEHIVAAVARRVHAVNPRHYVIAESGLNDPIVMRPPERGGWNCDAAWADDFHHSLRTLITEDRDGYYADFGSVAQLAKAFHRPHVDDGEYSPFRRRRFGAPAEDVPPERFVVFSQNHDQVGNRAYGDRMPAAARPLAAFCTLLSPFVPHAVHGRGVRRAGARFSTSPTTSTRTSPRPPGRDGAASSPPSPSSRPRCPTPRTHGRSSAPSSPAAADQGLARLYRELIAARKRLPRGTPRGDRVRRALPLAGGAPRRRYELACNFGAGPVEHPLPRRDDRAERRRATRI